MTVKNENNGYVYLIGAGPGDPGLITLKGREAIARAEVILYDYLAHKELLSFARPDAELIYAGKVGGAHNREQWQINEMLVEKAHQGKLVARLKGGDPFIFGRGGEECEALVAAGIPFEIVPGVTAAVGAAAYAGIPLTHRDFTTSVTFVTGHESSSKEVSGINWPQLSLGNGTLVFYMGMKNLSQITANLIVHGRPSQTPVALVRWGTRPEQHVLSGTLADIAEKAHQEGFKAPAVIIVGDVVRLRDKLRWFDARPLFGKRILVTRATDQAGVFSRLLEGYGAQVLECPTIVVTPPESFAALDEALHALKSYDWLLFTSVNGVRYFFERLSELGFDSRALGSCRVAAVGSKTSEALASHGIRPDLLPSGFHAEGLVEKFAELGVAGQKALYPKADRARDVLPRGLAELGMEVVAPVAYRTAIPDSLSTEALEALEERRVDCVTFTSSSTVSNLATLLGENRLIHLLQGVAVASIGPVTSATCRELGLRVDLEPEKSTIEALTEAIVTWYSSH
ncbi:MAG: uroporphyrinogen-III C-methyltransferase [Deltaproteobacteria bacterium]|nr:uroporphyrinogen-III C-methyltransferase [Deltaproteobacteria bacterium]TLN03454.1 MAG: uroporphyrinogen-III C-methyltransferase [bacterium]